MSTERTLDALKLDRIQRGVVDGLLDARFSRTEVWRALRAADAPEDSMATEDDLLRYQGRTEAVDIMRDMLGLSE